MMRLRFSRMPGIQLGRLKITMDPLLPFMVAFLAWMLSTRYFPYWFYASEQMTYVKSGLWAALGVILSIFLHEIGHTLAARWMNMPVKTIHLLLLGGMAELRERPNTAKQEGMIALAGPITSFIMAGIFQIALMISAADAPSFSTFILQFLVAVNILLGVFNLIPIFPLDGGRAMRALLWSWNNDFYKASVFSYKVSASLVGIICALALSAYFFWSPASAIWIGLLGVYLAWITINSKPELMTVPSIHDMVLKLPVTTAPQEFSRAMHQKWGKEVISEAIVPVQLSNTEPTLFFKGSDFNALSQVPAQTLPFPVALTAGRFIDFKAPETFMFGKAMEAQYVPVFNAGEYQGMADAYELRFWLNQGLRYQ